MTLPTENEIKIAIRSVDKKLGIIQSKEDVLFLAIYRGIPVGAFDHDTLIKICLLFMYQYQESEKRYEQLGLSIIQGIKEVLADG